MKTILITTDFAAPSQTAGHFAIYLANIMKANVTFCHAIEQLAASSMPIFSDERMKIKDSAINQFKSQALDFRVDELDSGITGTQIEFCTGFGSVTEVVSNLVREKSVNLVVTGMFGAGVMKRLLLGSNSQGIIDNISCPVLLIPFSKLPEAINKIAFASDLSKGDIELIHSLVSFARPFDAEILVVHISEGKADHHQIEKFLQEVTNKVNYHKIYYRHIEDKVVSRGLSWIAKNGFIDIFAMVHRRKVFPGNLLSSSHTQELSKNIDIPLLVFQENHYPVF
jgi:nucleotide-binding universal stress UspA family protein